MSVIYSGYIKDLHENQMKSFEVHKGLNVSTIVEFQQEWSLVLQERLQDIINKGKSNEETLQMINDSHVGDVGWNWTRKILFCQSDQYEWFFVKIEEKVEAVCILLHPHNSRIDSKNIFYVDYLAVAPWNRNTSYGDRKYASLGTQLLSVCCNQTQIDLPYRNGFSLHSLPQALTYYTGIGMQDYGIDSTKENLNYLEMDEKNSEQLVVDYVS